MKKFFRHDWWPPLGMQAFWLHPKWTEKEAALGAALAAVINHDRANCIRDRLPMCAEFAHAERLLDALYPQNKKDIEKHFDKVMFNA